MSLEIILLCAGAFSWGVAVVRFHIFPYLAIRWMVHLIRRPSDSVERPGMVSLARSDDFVPSGPEPSQQSWDLMLLGDSTIFGLGASLTGYGYRTIDLSFRGQTMREVRQSLPESLLNEPRAIIVAAGLNDIATVGHRTAASSDVDEAALNQYAILKEASTAGIHLLMLSILIPNRDMQGCYFAPFLNALNGQIESHARETELGGFLDLNRFLSDPENGLLPAFTLDGLHLNKFGMCSVANAVVQWLGERDVRLVLDADKPFSLGSRRGSWWYAHD